MGEQVHKAHQQEPPDPQHHEQEEDQDGRDGLHGVIAQVPLREAQVHQLPVEVVEGRLGGPRPGSCLLLLLLLLAGTRAPQGCARAPVEEAL